MDGSEGVIVWMGSLTGSAWLDWPGPMGIPPSLHNKTWIGLSAPEIHTAEISRHFYIPPPVRHALAHTQSAHASQLIVNFSFLCWALECVPIHPGGLNAVIKAFHAAHSTQLSSCAAPINWLTHTTS